MNSKVFGSINPNTWAVNGEIGHQFDVLNAISNPKSYSTIDVCQLCKNPGDVKLSPDSVISVDEGCRCNKSEAPANTSGGAVVDVSNLATEESAPTVEEVIAATAVEPQVVETPEGGDYVESSPTVEATATGETKYIAENNTVAPSDATDEINAQAVEEQTQKAIEEQNAQLAEAEQAEEAAQSEQVEIVGVDDGAIEKFCTGRMSPIEYSINITIIILFIAISVMAIMMIFKLAYSKCLGCGGSCGKVCPRCGCCERCCECGRPIPQPLPKIEEPVPQPQSLGGGSLYTPLEPIMPTSYTPSSFVSEPISPSFVAKSSQLTGSIF